MATSVDSTDEDSTVITADVSHRDDGMYAVHLMPMRNDDRIRVELHREKDLAIIEPSTGWPV
ncbi:hypothetical protein ACFWP3_14250 [Streptomyces sp. NPDC058525]|uniref:hypothetical protein n=1 Tax=Streptomyces sp. NPDC058525 TaxID=3346538 RepID=UPI00365B5F56